MVKQAQPREDARELVPFQTLKPPHLPISDGLRNQLEVTDPEWRVLVDSVFPKARSVEAVAMAISYCRKHDLDIFARPVNIVPMYSSALQRMVETVWPGIALFRIIAHRTKEYAGLSNAEYGPIVTRLFKQE